MEEEQKKKCHDHCHFFTGSPLLLIVHHSHLDILRITQKANSEHEIIAGSCFGVRQFQCLSLLL